MTRARGKENVCLCCFITIIEKKSDAIHPHQVSPIILHVRSPLSEPVNIPVTQSNQGLLGPLPGSTGTSGPDANQPASLPRLQMQGDARWEAYRPPPVSDAILALADLRTLLKSRNTVVFSDRVLRTRLDHLDCFFAIYVTGKGWTEATDYTATIIGRGTACSQQLRKWGQNYIRNRSALPYHQYANSGHRSLLNNIDFIGELFAHVTGAGLHVSAQVIVDFMKKPEVVERYQISKPVTLDTACKWMSRLNFKWQKPPKGTYIDGHERPDVMNYHQNTYLPALAQYEPQMCAWDKDNLIQVVDPSHCGNLRDL